MTSPKIVSVERKKRMPNYGAFKRDGEKQSWKDIKNSSNNFSCTQETRNSKELEGGGRPR